MSNKFVDIVEKLTNRKILVVGDLVLDEYWMGDIERVSREAPVLILDYDGAKYSLGGAANAINNISSLAGKVYPVSVIGMDSGSENILNLFDKNQVFVDGIFRDKDVTTTTKVRVMAGCLHTQKQQVLRIDKRHKTALSLDIEKQMIDYINKTVGMVDAMLISDYGLGVLGKNMVDFLNDLSTRINIPIVLDSRYSLSKYKNVTIAAPNEDEASKILEIAHIDEDNITSCVFELKNKLHAKAMLITMGKNGMALHDGDRFVRIPVFGPTESVDVTGAGDTVCAVLTLALASGASFEDASRLANAAASIVVMQRGTAVVSTSELKALAEKL